MTSLNKMKQKKEALRLRQSFLFFVFEIAFKLHIILFTLQKYPFMRDSNDFALSSFLNH